MTTLWRLGSDIGAAAEAMKSVPMFNFDARPLPETYSILCRQIQRQQLQDIWTPEGIYCPVCFNVSVDLPLFAKDSTDKNGNRSDLYISWTVVLEELVKSAESSCFFCSFMVSRFFNDPGYSYVWTNAAPARSNPVTCCGCPPMTQPPNEKVQKAVDRIRKFCDQWKGPDKAYVGLIAQPIDFKDESNSFCKVRFQAATSNLSPQDLKAVLGFRREIVLEMYSSGEATTYLRHDPPIIDHGDEGSLLQARRWIVNCVQSHESCPDPQIQTLPTRTIEILDGQEVRLRSDPREDVYVTLSYCWGGPQPFATSSVTLKDRHDALNVSEFPAVIQDAIHVTRDLGFRHLWVDSICIVQDSPEDKSRELGKMASYYKNSFLTICAGVGNCNTSFRTTKHQNCASHPTWKVSKNLMPMPLLGPAGRTGFALFCEETPYSWSMEPISSRAWTYQEQLLSTRTLMYGNRLLWNCRSSQHSAGGVEDWSTDIRNKLNRSISTALTMAEDQEQQKSEKTDANRSDFLFDKWYLGVREYSYRSLTLAHDKLPAISALASEFGALLNDEYVVGLWRGDLLRGLMWSTYPDMSPKLTVEWRAPSWSWTSTDSVISFNQLPPSNEAIAQIVTCKTMPKDPLVPFGEVASTVLEIRAPVLPGNLATTMGLMKQDNYIPRQSDTLTYRIEMADMTVRGVGAKPGDPEWQVADDHVLLVLFAHPFPKLNEEKLELTQPRAEPRYVSNDGKRLTDIEDSEAVEVASLSGLVLVPVKSDEGTASSQENIVYSRIGRFMHLSLRGFEHLKSGTRTQTVSLV